MVSTEKSMATSVWRCFCKNSWNKSNLKVENFSLWQALPHTGLIFKSIVSPDYIAFSLMVQLFSLDASPCLRELLMLSLKATTFWWRCSSPSDSLPTFSANCSFTLAERLTMASGEVAYRNWNKLVISLTFTIKADFSKWYLDILNWVHMAYLGCGET